MDQFEVSIIIPFYNVEDYIEKCAHSLFQQTLESIQFVFVNDKSTDDSLLVLNNVIKKYPKREKDVLIINHKDNRGSAAARNTGLDNVTGRYIGWVDADDWIEKDMFEKLLNRAELSSLDMVWCDYYYYNNSGCDMSTHVTADNSEDFLKDLLKDKVGGFLWNKLFRASFIESHNIRFVEQYSYGEDRLFLFKFLLQTPTIVYLPFAGYYYRQDNETSMVKSPIRRHIDDEVGNVSLVIDLLKNYRVSFFSKNDIAEFKLRAKKRLLYSLNISDIKYWVELFPEVNMLALRSKGVGVKYRLLVFSLICNSEILLKAWVYFRKRSLKK